jgi:hypothetical protein
MNYEAYFKRVDKNKRAFSSLSPIQEAEKDMGAVAFWATRGKGYSFNRVNRAETGIVGIQITGVDGVSGSAIRTTAPSQIMHGYVGEVTHVFWTKDSIPDNYTRIGGSPDDDLFNKWILVYRVATSIGVWNMPSDRDYYDIRVLRGAVSEETLTLYFKNLEIFLPRV